MELIALKLERFCSLCKPFLACAFSKSLAYLSRKSSLLIEPESMMRVVEYHFTFVNASALVQIKYSGAAIVNSDHVDPLFWDVDPPLEAGNKVRAVMFDKNTKG